MISWYSDKIFIINLFDINTNKKQAQVLGEILFQFLMLLASPETIEPASNKITKL